MKYFLDFMAALQKGSIAPAYLFYGPETYLREQALLRLREKLLPPESAELNCDVLDGASVTGDDIAAAVNSAGFLAGRRLVIVRDPLFLQAGGSKDERLEKFIFEFLERTVGATSLVLDTSSSVDRRKKIYKAIATLGGAIEFTRLKAPDLIKWLAKQAKEENCSLNRDAAEELLFRCGQDMHALYQEMRKLACRVGTGGVIDLATVRELVAGRMEENIFDVVDAIGEKDAAKALYGISNLLMQKQQPQQILGMVARQFRLIHQVKGLGDAGHSREEIIKLLKLHPFVYRKIKAQEQNFQAGQLVDIINRLVEIDYLTKTGGAAFYPSVANLILQVCAA